MSELTSEKKTKRRKAVYTFPNVVRLSLTSAHHLALCVDVLLHHVCVRQSHLHALYKEAGCPPTSRHVESVARTGKWLALHLAEIAEKFEWGGETKAVFWFRPPESGAARAALLNTISLVAAEQSGGALVRSKVRALPVKQFLRAFPSAVAKRVLKSMLHTMTGTSFLRNVFNWREGGVRTAHSIVTATLKGAAKGNKKERDYTKQGCNTVSQRRASFQSL